MPEVEGIRRTGPSADAPPADACTLEVAGMDCASCAASVDRALRALPGVRGVEADVVGERVRVEFEPGSVERAELAEAVRRAGYAVRDPSQGGLRVYEVEGLCCSTEARQLESAIGGVRGAGTVTVDIVGKRVSVAGAVAPGEVERAVARVGMRARAVGVAPPTATRWERHGRVALAAGSGLFWVGSVLAARLLGEGATATALAVGAMVLGGWYVVPRGLRAARNGALDMNFLMTVAAVGALLIGETGEAASAMFLFAVAQLLESRSMDRARNAVRALMELSPTTATVLRDGEELRVPADTVWIGERVRVRPGEKVPVDGEVLSGRSSVNQAPITGESIPVEKEPGSEVFAGTLNGDGALVVRSTRQAEDTTLARIIHSVEEAQASRAPSQAFVDRFARVYTPAVVVAAALMAVLPPLLGMGAWGEWVERALVLLVVACPCALVISTPVTIVSALAGGARRGILVKGGLHLENAGRARVVAIDKTGTLTRGEPAVVEVTGLDGTPVPELLSLAAAAESHSEHPLARALVRHAREQGATAAPAEETTAIPGRGVRARVAGRRVLIGTERLFREQGADTASAAELLRMHEAAGRTAVLVGAEDGGTLRALGVVAIADQIRPQAREALRELHRAGIERVVMLTGDNPGTARAVAEALGPDGVDEYRAALLPQDKVAAVEELRRRYGTVVFVGDGVNDAPALAAADVGVAMGGAGTDVALETADIALMGDELGRLPTLIRSARKAEGIIRANIAISLLTKAAFMVLAMLGWATLWMAVAADMGTSLLVTLNGLRAMRE